jgi:anti-anti-sigma factor
MASGENTTEAVMSTFQLRGTLDQSNVTEALEQPRLALHREQNLSLDLSQVTWIDSAGLAGLIRLLAEARRLGGELQLIDASAVVHRALLFARLDQLFPIRREVA